MKDAPAPRPLAAPGGVGRSAPSAQLLRSRLGESAVVALAGALLAWYRVRYALPAPLGGYGLLRRRVTREGAELVGRPGAPGDASATGPPDLRREDAGAEDATPAGRLVRLFRRGLERAPVRASCVPRSLALERLLRLHGFPAAIRIGLRRTAGGALAGHAWVEHHGAVIAESRDFVASFAPLSFGLVGGAPRLEGAR